MVEQLVGSEATLVVNPSWTAERAAESACPVAEDREAAVAEAVAEAAMGEEGMEVAVLAVREAQLAARAAQEDLPVVSAATLGWATRAAETGELGGASAGELEEGRVGMGSPGVLEGGAAAREAVVMQGLAAEGTAVEAATAVESWEAAEAAGLARVMEAVGREGVGRSGMAEVARVAVRLEAADLVEVAMAPAAAERAEAAPRALELGAAEAAARAKVGLMEEVAPAAGRQEAWEGSRRCAAGRLRTA